MDTNYFTEGWDARINGLYLAHNPYEYGTFEYRQWCDGYSAAVDEEYYSKDYVFPFWKSR